MVQQAVQAARPRWKDEPEARGKIVEVVTQLEEVPPVRGTEAGLHDALLNLLFNAVDAMLQGGTITIGVRQVEEAVELTVADTGIGMDEETRRRVFEPFFTTKMDVGTGLGLSTVYRMVTSWGGRVEVESAPGKGSRFILRLPCGREVAAAEQQAEVRRGRSGKVLILEDDEGACELLERLLAEQHEVDARRDGRTVLEQFAPGQYDVAVIDLGIAGTPGDQVAREMRQADPALVTVLITGWQLQESDQRLAQFDFRLQKPFDDLEQVERVVAQGIEQHDDRARGMR